MAEIDPLVGFKFSLLLGGKVAGYFTECSGIGIEVTMVEHKIVTDKAVDFVKKQPGRLKWTDVTLKSGVTDNTAAWDWMVLVSEGNMDAARQDCSIIMYDRAGKPKAQWDFEKAFPVKLNGPSPKSDGDEVSMEELTITHTGMQRVKV